MKKNKVAYLMVLPYMLIFSMFTLLPVLVSAFMSLTDFNMLEAPNWVGLDNYIRLFLDDDIFMTYSVKNTGGAFKLTGTLTQTDAPDELSIPVPVEIQVGRAKPIVKIVHTSSEPVQFTVAVPAATAKAVLDPGWSVLRR
jgi:ABC-type sugar transport system permease subunit